MINLHNNIPLELRVRAQWVGHKAKIPMSAKTFLAASSADSTTWSTYAEAIQAVEQNGWDGVGFMFAPPFVGIDLDHCVVDGVINDFATAIIEQCNSYTEFSPSKTGIHIICKGNIPRAIKSHKTAADGTAYDFLEVYNGGRYFTMTGDVVRPHAIIRTADLSFLAISEPRVASAAPGDDSRILKELNAITPGAGNQGRTPTFVRVIGMLKGKGLNQAEVSDYLEKWAAKYEYKTMDKLIADQFRRYPPELAATEDTASDSLIEFMADREERDFVVPGMIADRTINILAGLQESRKSWMLLDLAIAMASGTEWLGRVTCKRKRTLVIDQERPKGEMQRRINAMLAGRNLTIADLEGQLIPKVGTTIRINLDASFAAFEKQLQKIEPEVVLIDSLKAFQTSAITDNQTMQEVFERFKKLRNQYGLTFVLLHHENKGAYVRNREGLDVTAETIAGASSIAEVPEGIMISVNHDSESSTLYHVKNSYGIKAAPILVKVTDLNEQKTAIRIEGY